MYRTLCVLALLTLQAGLAHCFSWDIVVATDNRLEFYTEEKVTYYVTFTDVDIRWMTYDPYHNRVLFMNNSRSLLSYDIATRKSQTLIILEPAPTLDIFTYDPVSSLFYVIYYCKMYSYLVKHEYNHEVHGNFVSDLGIYCIAEIAVESCGRNIYWVDFITLERTRVNDSRREQITRNIDMYKLYSLTIDPQTQNIYWVKYYPFDHYDILSADLNGKHIRKLYEITDADDFSPLGLTVSNDFIYWVKSWQVKNKFFWKIPKNLPLGTNVKAKQIAFKETSTAGSKRFIAANYAIEEQTQGPPLCTALKRLLPNYSKTNDSDSLNVSTSGSLLRVNETKVGGESRVSGDTWNVPVCQYYCFHGNCSGSADGQPKCRCNAGYYGERCEVNVCQTYCLHGGVCSVSEQNNPVCQCTAGYEGERCDVPDFLIKCTQTVSMLKDILNTDLTSVTEGKGVK